MVFSELVLNLSNQVVSPLDHHVLFDSSMMRVLDLLKVIKFSWQFQYSMIGIHDSLLLEINTLLDENFSH
jgi:hypothetical protein